MKRLKSSEDLASYGEKGVSKDWVRRDEDSSLHRSSSHRNFYYKPDNGKKGLSSSSSRYDRSEDDRESFRSTRKRTDYDVESYDRRKGYDRYRDGGERGIMSSSPRGGYGGDRIHRSESFSVPRREFPKGFRSERDRSRREGSVSSWRRFGSGKDVDEGGSRSGVDSARGSRATSDDNGKVRSPRGLRDAKSPSWSKDAKSPSWSKDAKSPSLSKDAKSPPGSKDAKSPPRSRDSGSEQSKSVEVKKGEELPVESGNDSEMEEGELEPDPEPVPVLKHVAEDDASIGLNPNQKELNSDNIVEDKSLEDLASLSEEKVLLNQVSVPEEKAEIGMSEATPNVVKDVNELPGCVNTSVHKTSNDEDAVVTTADNEVTKDGHCASENSNCPDGVSDMLFKPCPLDAGQKENKGIDLEVKLENIYMPGPIEGVADRNGASGVALSFIDERENRSFKDKGKSLAVWPSNAGDAAEDISRTETRSLLNFRENDMEGPSTRGFELFFTDPVKKLDKAEQSSLKPKAEKMVLEPLELSLSLPNVLFPSSSQNTVQAPGSPSHARSVQSFTSSFQTSSDAFTASLSFSGSHPFSHNPSCSLTHNSFDNCEQSVGSRPIFQGVTWQGQSSNENANKEGTMFQRILSNGSGLFHHSQTSQGISNGQAQGQHHKVAEGSSKLPILDPQLSFNKQLTGVNLRHPNDVRSSSQSIGSHETGLDYRNDKNRVTREKNAVHMHRSNKQDEKEPLFAGGADFVDPIISMIVSEPIHIMAKRFNEMTGQSATNLKESVRDIILNPGKRWKLCGFQQALNKRSDITLEILLKSHRAQLEVLVALKTGLQDFLQRNYDISSSDLAEIFLNLRCRNLTCRSLLPVDECDCKICSQKNGFCSACMCLVCSKFDNASNTCSWVGCDVCLHWCHADCGLRESYIRNGHSATRSQGTTEMQFHCVACDHPSEMFGFVKEVFQNFAKGWTAETLSKELEYVRRIFRASEDARGKRLYDIAVQMLTRLANKSDLQEVQSYIMALLTNSDSFKSSSTLIVPEKEIPKKKQGEGTTGIAGSSQEPTWLKAVYSDKAPQSEKSTGLLPSFDFERNDKLIASSDLQRSARKDPGFDELESIVRIKEAEAKMFQEHADDARREAEGLKRIANAKNEKIEEEYTSRIRKLHLAEAEEIRRQKFEELQALERAHQEYFNMKMRMETNIKDLLLKMEATKCNFTM